MGISIAEVLKNVANAKPTERGTYMTEGNYLLEVKSLALKQLRKGLFFIGEFIVRESKKISSGAEENPNDVGTEVTYMIDMSKDAAAGNLNRCLAGIAGAGEGELTEEAVESILSDKQPLKGALVKDVMEVRETKNGGGVYGHHRWTTVQQDEKSILTRRQAQS